MIRLGDKGEKKVQDFSVKGRQKPIANSAATERFKEENGIDLIAKVQFLLQQDSYSFWTDGRRILAYDARYHQGGINEEFVNC
ncbi:hypothetical protein J1N35_040439 [Gossypium stocksii]|uniref:Uncharacterized protein n=1 Tax=Gossypium stocksii TaxID=47602 RepID=A0A9D3ZIA8_9ROSI|nr:hypothetical protein J1N35_040439 [Gossypium stocksii]